MQHERPKKAHEACLASRFPIRELISIKTSFSLSLSRQIAIFKYFVFYLLLAFSLLEKYFAIDFNIKKLLILFKPSGNASYIICLLFCWCTNARRPILICSSAVLSICKLLMHASDSFKDRHGKKTKANVDYNESSSWACAMEKSEKSLRS